MREIFVWILYRTNMKLLFLISYIDKGKIAYVKSNWEGTSGDQNERQLEKQYFLRRGSWGSIVLQVDHESITLHFAKKENAI